MKTKVLFFVFVMIIIIAKIIAGIEIGFLIATTMMIVGAVCLNGEVVLIGTMSLFFNILSVPLPPQAFPVCYIILALLGLVMALTIIVLLAKKEETEAEFGHIPTRKKAVTA